MSDHYFVKKFRSGDELTITCNETGTKMKVLIQDIYVDTHHQTEAVKLKLIAPATFEFEVTKPDKAD